MAYLLNSVNLTTYGITAGQAPGSNIAVQGCFDLPERIGDTHHIWDDDNTVEPYVAADEIFFAGRDIKFYGTIVGNNFAINTYLDAFYTAIKAFTTLVTFSTPYGDFSVQVKDVKTKKYNGALSLEIAFREPVVTLTGGSLPATGVKAYTIDGIPMSSFGLYVTKPEEIHDLPEIKSQYFTKYGAEGYQIVKRKANTLEIDGFLMATSLSDFQTKIKALYLAFSSSGLRYIKLNNEKIVVCFATTGFNVSNVSISASLVMARIRISLPVTQVYNICSTLITSWNNSTYELFASSGSSITQAIELGTAGRGISNAFAITSGESITIIFYCTNSGALPTLYMYHGGILSDQYTAVEGLNIHTFVTTGTDSAAQLFIDSYAVANYGTTEIYLIK
jgi:hypothetical protein